MKAFTNRFTKVIVQQALGYNNGKLRVYSTFHCSPFHHKLIHGGFINYYSLVGGDAVALLVEHRTSDREIAGSTPARALLTQQPYASYSHPCVSITKQYKLAPV